MKLSEEQKYEINRLAALIATARVRRYAVHQGLSKRETKEGVHKRVCDAEKQLERYLDELEVGS